MTHPQHQTTGQPKVVKSGSALTCVCPHCHSSLHDGSYMVLDVERQDRQSGKLHLSPHLNVFDVSSTIELEHGVEVADLRCSRCGQSLQREDVRCGECGSRAAQLLVEYDGLRTEFYICLRKGCHWHDISQAARSRLILEAVGFHRPDHPEELIQSGTTLDCSCPHCSHSLVQGEDLLLRVRDASGKQGQLALSPRLNEFRSSCTIELPRNRPAPSLACPWCDTSLVTADQHCELCGAPTARILVKTSRGDTGFHICTRHGCHFHGLDDNHAGMRLEQLRHR